MKYAQLLVGLLAGTALGGSVVASTGLGTKPAPVEEEAVKAIVRQVIMEEPKLIVESVQKMQMDEMQKQQQATNDMLKDPEVAKQVFEDPHAAVVGNKDSKRVVVEFFDYNCGACKMMFKNIDALLQKDKDVKVLFHEYPIFGPQSEENSKIGIAVWRLYPEKYFEFHSKMMTHEGRSDPKAALDIAKELGMDTAKIEAESKLKEVADVLDSNRQLGEKLNVRGTPTFVIGEEIVPHGMGLEDLEEKLNAASQKPTEAPAKAEAPAAPEGESKPEGDTKPAKTQ